MYEGRALKKLALDAVNEFGSLTMSRLNQMMQIYRVTGVVHNNSELTGFIYQPPTSRFRVSFKELKYLRAKGNLSMCVAQDWMPYEGVKDGIHKGVVADYMKLLQQKLGVPFSVVPTSSINQARLFIQTGKCDLVSGVTSTYMNGNYYDYSSPYLSVPVVVAINAGADFGNVMPGPIAVAKGTAFEEIIRIRYPGVKMVAVENGLEGLNMLQRGKVKGMLCTNAHFNGLISEHNIKGLALRDATYDILDICVAVKKGNLLLVGLMDKAIRSITKQERQEITSRWINIKPPKQTIPVIVWQTLIGIVFVVILMTYRYRVMSRHNQELSKLAETDWLTQVPNRHKIIDRLEDYLIDSHRYSRDVSLIYFDVDDFKAINDSYGHNEGDRILKVIAELACDVTRKTDVFGRWGGEEFILACQESNIKEAVKLAEKLSGLIQNNDFKLPINITCSFGVAEYIDGEQLENFVSRADKAMYKAKKSGKNRVVAYQDE